MFKAGRFELHSGEQSNFLIDCETLTDADLEALAEQIAARVPPFGQVEGVANGGLRIAEVLSKHAGGPSGQLLIVDDVLTSGGSMEEQRAGREAYGAVIFCRGTDWPSWIIPLFILNPVR